MEGEAEYGFWHPLVRDVAYQQIPRAAARGQASGRRGLAGDKGGEQVEDSPTTPARRWPLRRRLATSLDTEIAPRAARYALLAGERMLGLDTVRALELLDRAKTLTPEEDPGHPARSPALGGGALEVAACPRPPTRSTTRSTGSMPRATCFTPGRRSDTFRASAGASASPTPSDSARRPAIAPRADSGPRADRRSGAEWRAGASWRGKYAPAIETADRTLELADQLALATPGGDPSACAALLAAISATLAGSRTASVRSTFGSPRVRAGAKQPSSTTLPAPAGFWRAPRVQSRRSKTHGLSRPGAVWPTRSRPTPRAARSS